MRPWDQGSPPDRRPVIFDLDGVIVDTEVWWDAERAALAAEHGREWTEADRESVMGANSRQWSATIRRRLDLALPDEEIERRVVEGVVERYRTTAPPGIDGATEAVRRIARGRPLGLASSAHPAVIRAALEALELGPVFDAVVSSDEVEHGKPAPDVYLLAARRLGVEPATCLVVEDSLSGVRAGKAAGMTVVLVPSARVPPAGGAREIADLVLDRLADLEPDAVGR